MAKKPKSFQCPRCGSRDVLNLAKVYYCKDCKSEFDKKSYKLLEKEQMLSEKEKSDIFKLFKDFSERSN